MAKEVYSIAACSTAVAKWPWNRDHMFDSRCRKSSLNSSIDGSALDLFIVSPWQHACFRFESRPIRPISKLHFLPDYRVVSGSTISSVTRFREKVAPKCPLGFGFGFTGSVDRSWKVVLFVCCFSNLSMLLSVSHCVKQSKAFCPPSPPFSRP